MRPAEGIARIEQIAGVGDIDRICRNGPLLPEILSDGQVESGMWGKVRRPVPIEKSRTELECRRRPHASREGQ